MPALEDGGGAAGFEAVVCADEVTRGKSHSGGRRKAHRNYPRELGQDLERVDAQYPRLVCIAPALVGASDSGLVLRRLRRNGCVARGPRRVRKMRRKAAAGSGRSGYVVQLRAM